MLSKRKFEKMSIQKKTSESSNSIFSQLSHYFVKKISKQSTQNDVFVSIKRSVRIFNEFSWNQKKSYKINMIVFQMKKKANDEIAHEIRIIDTAIKTSTRMYIFSKNKESSV